MMNYSIEDAINIINSCDESFNPNTRHFNVRNVQRIGNLELIYKTFLHNPLMGIIKQDFNKFRLYFEHNFKSSKDISLVIAINNDRTVNFVTVMLTDRNKRVK
ncbi:hypothetical protein [uncultured Methanobrevibacter sp.]|uniref:hypothetical protein n=1 Tax=uncultured Methanobrevibacter sp. TaxID=253161 RepID=UPI0025D1CF97|nr:hypothetical protein [uncultured Methanobrevibacter sp.]